MLSEEFLGVHKVTYLRTPWKPSETILEHPRDIYL